MCKCLEDGWYPGASHCPSPNFNERPQGEISLLVIHNISLPPGQFATGQVHAFFHNRLQADAHPYFADIASMRVSAHFLIERDGHISQFVSCLDRAWHAGVSSFAGRENCNDFSLGIELEGTDYQAFTDKQYESLIALSLALQRAYPAITIQRICGHSDIAPVRKTDPGPFFDWARFRAALKSHCGPLNNANGGLSHGSDCQARIKPVANAEIAAEAALQGAAKEDL